MDRIKWTANDWDWYRKVWMDRTGTWEWTDVLEQLEWFGINRMVWEGQDELNWIVWIRMDEMDRMNQNKYGFTKMDRMDLVGLDGLGWMGWIQRFDMVQNELEFKL